MENVLFTSRFGVQVVLVAAAIVGRRVCRLQMVRANLKTWKAVRLPVVYVCAKSRLADRQRAYYTLLESIIHFSWNA